MLNAEDRDFFEFWNKHRVEYSSFSSKMMRGLPMASLFGLPILMLFFVVTFFIPDWSAKLGEIKLGTIIMMIIAVLAIIVFVAFMRMHFLWEMNEQRFEELQSKIKKEDAAK